MLSASTSIGIEPAALRPRCSRQAEQFAPALTPHLTRSCRYPGSIVVDHGPEFTSKTLHGWAEDHGVTLDCIEPGEPVQNAYTESFNGRLRDECLNEHWFRNLLDARSTIEQYRRSYNTERPHGS